MEMELNNIYFLKCICMIVIAYFFGSVSYARIISKYFADVDITTVGSRNPGAANVFNTISPFMGILTGIADSSKAIILILIGKYLLNIEPLILYIIGLSASVGHCYPIYYKFKGGKAAGTTMGTILTIQPVPFLIGLGTAILILISPVKLIKSNKSTLYPVIIITISTALTFILAENIKIKIGAFILALFILIRALITWKKQFKKYGVKR